MPSTVIADFDYDAERAQLTVSFVTGRVYRYFEVPPDCAAEFQAAFSKGAFFNRHIRDQYPCREVTVGLS
jgi:KTSC domain